jgi:hypothetical protein
MKLILLLLVFCLPASAHELYDPECCNMRHCHRAVDGTVTQNRNFIFVPGYAPVPKISPKARTSQDDHDHICTSDDGAMLYCVYVAQRGM